jgi:tetratricopeptide (TPR) repeat protein
MKNIDKIIEEYNKYKSSVNYNLNDDIKILFHIADELYNIDKKDESLKYLEYALEKNKDLNNPNYEESILTNIGFIYFQQEKFQEALGFYQQALVKAKELKLEDKIITILGNIALVYSKQSQVIEALKIYEEALKLAQNINNQTLIIEYAEQIAFLESNSKNFDKALFFYKLALEEAEKLGIDISIAKILSYMGNIYVEKSLLQNAVKCYTKSVEIFETKDDLSSLAIVKIALADTYSTLGNNEQAMKLYDEVKGLANNFLGK